MGIFKALWKLISKIVSRILKAIVAFVKKFWFIILIIAVIYFAPFLLTQLVAAGAPTWMTTAASWVATTLTPSVVSGVGWLASGAKTMGSSAWAAFADLGMGTQLALASGVAAAVAPEEFADLVTEAANLASDVVGTVVGAVTGSFLSSPIGIVAIAAGAIWLLGTGDDERPTQTAVPNVDVELKGASNG